MQMESLEQHDAFDTLLGAKCFLGQLHESNGLTAASLGAHEGHSMEALRNNLSAVRAAQEAAQLSGADLPMLDDLLPLSELHDPFIEAMQHHFPMHAAGGGGGGGGQEAAAGALAAAAALAPPPHQLDVRSRHAHAGSGGPFSPTYDQASSFFGGVPAYAEPNSPDTLLNNHSADLSGLPGGLVAGAAGMQQLGHMAAVFGAQHAFAVQVQQAAAAAAAAHQHQRTGSSHGLPPAIAAAQQKAASAAAHLAAAAARVSTEKAGSCGDVAGSSHLSGSAGSVADTLAVTAPAATATVTAAATATATATPSATFGLPPSDDSSGGEQVDGDGDAEFLGEDYDMQHTGTGAGSELGGSAAGAGAGAGALAAPIFTMGTTGDSSGPAARPPAKRGGRPREKKSYDALIDPNLPPDEIRRLRRMLSNRESARRSRRRRQSQLSTLEVELEQLKTDNERLESELSQASTVVQQLAADKQVLLAELERLRCQLSQTQVHSGPAMPSPPAPALPQPQHPMGVQVQAQVQVPMPAQVAVAVAAPMHAVPPNPASLAAQLAPPADQLSPVVGCLPPFIEQAQRLANKLTMKRPKDEPQASP